MLRLPKETLNRILDKAKNSPIEICGFLLGKGDEVYEAVFVSNRLNSPIEFEMDPEEMLKALEYAEKKNLEIVGIFHSHVYCPPFPSGKDLKGMKLWPVVWVIVTSSGEVKAWQMGKDGKIVEVEVVISER
ncbi:Mov34/MPN/PAD-1 family protein [Pyrococcus sp. ST04]|uniref:Mov34/MPN/PAD-1 family protein n=1 Tax=Pyrococcus sp. ST04 TaxID=1183377 RepID=UPI0002605EB3|nr:M67 family metallopeptidase [Pyrococcus sp. ST04]AFK22607.1 hypothetical protein containing JAB1/MPN domain [Pyrococcus sp. ST04]